MLQNNIGRVDMMRVNVYELVLQKVKGVNVNLEGSVVRSPDCAYQIIEQTFNLSLKPSENFGLICLNTKNKVAGAHIVSIGSLNSAIVHPREVFKTAIVNNSSGFIMFHNHPSGDPTPSREDIELTQKMVEIGEMLGVDVLDHIIVGESSYVSLKEQGLM
jgi:DNA repair protein RadC